MDAASSSEQRACGIHMEWEQVFVPGTMKINTENSNVWLSGVPDLSVECSEIELSKLLGEKVCVGEEEFYTSDSSLEDASSILLPKKFARSFPLKSSGSRISRVFLREDFINLWNALVDEQDTDELRILSAASGLGKSIYLYLVAVFARHFGIPVQYIGNTRDLLEPKESSIASNFAAMLLFMNLKILDELGPFYPRDPDYRHLRGLPMKHVIFYAHERGDLLLCGELRRNFMNMKPRNLLIVDEHNALWQELGNDPNTWLPFFKLYARPVGHATRYCKFVIAGSQHHEFESKLPSGYEDSMSYVEPLSKEEFEIWENLSDYPPNFKDKRNEVIDLTGLVPRVIGMLINMANASGDLSFEEVASNLKADISNSMKMRHVEYVDSLNDVKKADFAKMLYNLFLGGGTPSMTICDNAYRDRGLLITLKDRSLQLYNSVARDILFDTFTQFYFSENHLVELSQELKKARKGGSGGGACFEELFLGLVLRFRPEIQTYSRARSRTIHFQSNVLFRFDGKCFDRRLSSITTSCWIKFSRNYPRLDYAYVDMIDDGSWMLYLIQVSVSSFPAHDVDSAQLERLFMKTGGSVQLASPLNSFFAEVFEVSPVYDAREKIADFEVTDSQGISFRDRISILYVTPLTREDAKADSAPDFVEFLTFDNFPENMKSYIDLGQKVRSRRSSPSRRSVKRIKSEET